MERIVLSKMKDEERANAPERMDITCEEMKKAYEKSQSLLHVANLSLVDAEYILKVTTDFQRGILKILHKGHSYSYFDSTRRSNQMLKEFRGTIYFVMRRDKSDSANSFKFPEILCPTYHLAPRLFE